MCQRVAVPSLLCFQHEARSSSDDAPVSVTNNSLIPPTTSPPQQQIYNEQVDDLLKGTQNLRLRQAEEGDWVVEGLSWFQCSSPQFLLQCFQNGRKRLMYAETQMNKHSSRCVNAYV